MVQSTFSSFPHSKCRRLITETSRMNFFRKTLGNTENWTRGCWVRSANATSVLCHLPEKAKVCAVILTQPDWTESCYSTWGPEEINKTLNNTTAEVLSCRVHWTMVVWEVTSCLLSSECYVMTDLLVYQAHKFIKAQSVVDQVRWYSFGN